LTQLLDCGASRTLRINTDHRPLADILAVHYEAAQGRLVGKTVLIAWYRNDSCCDWWLGQGLCPRRLPWLVRAWCVVGDARPTSARRGGSAVGETDDQPSYLGEAEVDEFEGSVSALSASSCRARRTVRHA
jgi:hypothetical protein